MHSYRSIAELERGIAHVVAREPRFGPVVTAHGLPSLRQAEDGLAGLLTIVTEQFLSLGAAAAIWQRIETAVIPFTPDIVLSFDKERLMALGLSSAKVRTFHGVADAVRSRALDFEVLHSASNSEIHRILCALPGIGPWTADIYLLSCLARADAWPVGDLALQRAAQDLLCLPARPDGRDMLRLAEPWRPHRAAAARLLWSHYRGIKGLKQA